MTLRSLALNNIRGNWRSYSAFFFSSVFSVMIFYIYAAFLEHPDVVSGYILAASKVRRGMVFSEYLIVVFSFLFVLYSNSAFLKTRQQEFGLFSLFGMTRAQLRKLVVYENAAIALLAVAFGIGLGMLFSKLFFMALAVLLNMEEKIRFAVSLKAVWMTGAGFFVMFMVISGWTALRIGRAEIVDLLKAARRPKGSLLYSKWLVALAAVCLAAAYGMALAITSDTFTVLSLPILVTVVIGTYFLFTQMSVLILKVIQKRASLYYNRTNMIVFAQLGYKIRDNARILFIVSILSAVIMTALGAVYIMQVNGKEGILQNSPYSLAYMERGFHAHEVMDPDRLREIAERDGFSIIKEAKLAGIAYSLKTLERSGDIREYENMEAIIVSAADYNKLAKISEQPEILPESGKLTLAIPYRSSSDAGGGHMTGRIDGRSAEFEISGEVTSKVINIVSSNYFTFVMDDLAYTKLLAEVPEKVQLVIYGFELSDWERSAGTAAKLSELVPETLQALTDFRRAQNYEEMKETVGLTMFIAVFISLLFFIASGSMIYFKLFTELQEDQMQFRSLSRIGMTKGEVRRIVAAQIGIVFFIPVVVAICHALFAMAALDNMMESSNWIYSFVIIGIFIAMQTLYFFIACSSYMKSMHRGAAF